MNNTKRTFNPLLGQNFRYTQPESAKLRYSGNWGAAIQPGTIISSAWEAEQGTVKITDETHTDTTTSALIEGMTGETVIVNRVVLSSGEVDERVLKLLILSEYGDTTIYDGNVQYLATDLGAYL